MDPELKLWTNYPDLFWVATTKTGKVVGSIGQKHIDSDTVNMHRFCVDNEFQKFGIGQKLVQTSGYCKGKWIFHCYLLHRNC